MRIIQAFILTSAILLSAGEVQAKEQAAYHGQRSYRGMDRDNNGSITRNEWRGNNRSFSNHDYNRDGILTNNEVNMAGSWNSREDHHDRRRNNGRNGQSRGNSYNNYNQGWNNGNYNGWNNANRNGWNDGYSRGQNSFRRYDANNDGTLSQSEWPNNTGAYYQSLDVNKDGTISRDEFYHRSNSQVAVAVFGELNTDGDTMVSRSEWRGDQNEFSYLDSNHDNYLTDEEFNSTVNSGNGTGSDTLQSLFAQLFKNG